MAYAARNVTPVDGFGYLVPRASATQSGTLGVVFDSRALPPQDRGADVERLTVMLGLPSGTNATVATAEEAALQTVREHLRISQAPADMDATIATHCIPTYTVGYVDRLADIHSWVSRQLSGRLSVDVLTRHNWNFAKDSSESPKKKESDRVVDEEQDDRERRRRRKREHRGAREREQLMLDEVAPRETGRDAKLAKRRNLNQIRHAEPSLDPELPDHDLYGSSANDLAALKRERDLKEKQRLERKAVKQDPVTRQSRLKDHIDKERSTVELLRAMAQQSQQEGLGMMPPSKK
ncbi:condensin complex non-SMC subunit Cnd1 [Coemansia sp. RSA 455]|nr:condensin complex non-SMC subunit Cnd1 [Coemansia sp. RSA 455]